MDELKAGRAALLLSVMISELMKTMFPRIYGCVAVCPVLPESQDNTDSAGFEKLARAYPTLNVGALPVGSDNSVTVAIIEDSVSGLGVVRSFTGDPEGMLGMISETLRDYLGWYRSFEDNGILSKRYLWFGAEKEPECFGFSELYELLKSK